MQIKNAAKPTEFYVLKLPKRFMHELLNSSLEVRVSCSIYD